MEPNGLLIQRLNLCNLCHLWTKKQMSEVNTLYVLCEYLCVLCGKKEKCMSEANKMRVQNRPSGTIHNSPFTNKAKRIKIDSRFVSMDVRQAHHSPLTTHNSPKKERKQNIFCNFEFR